MYKVEQALKTLKAATVDHLVKNKVATAPAKSHSSKAWYQQRKTHTQEKKNKVKERAQTAEALWRLLESQSYQICYTSKPQPWKRGK